MALDLALATLIMLAVMALPVVMLLIAMWRIGTALLDIAKSHKALADSVYPAEGVRDLAESLDAISRSFGK